jgi:hypothetical protein
MRCVALAAVLILSVSQVGGGHAAEPATAAPGSSAAGSSDAAAKHAKRTACLKDAKTKKLVGADKTAYLKNCMAAT